MNTANCPSVPESHQFESSLVADARELLSRHPLFHGRVHLFTLEADDGALIVTGSVPTFYLKQMLQAALRDVRGAARILNRVEVLSANGVSSCPRWRRELCALEHCWLGKTQICFPTCDVSPGIFQGDQCSSIG
jgi:hypothetical protein